MNETPIPPEATMAAERSLSRLHGAGVIFFSGETEYARWMSSDQAEGYVARIITDVALAPLRDRLATAERQRDVALAALKDVIQWADDRAESDTFHGDPFDPHTRDFIEAAIAACKENADA